MTVRANYVRAFHSRRPAGRPDRTASTRRRSIETLETRILLSGNILEYFPLDVSRTYSYSGTIDGNAATETMNLSTNGSYTVASSNGGQIQGTVSSSGLQMQSQTITTANMSLTYTFTQPLTIAPGTLVTGQVNPISASGTFNATLTGGGTLAGTFTTSGTTTDEGAQTLTLPIGALSMEHITTQVTGAVNVTSINIPGKNISPSQVPPLSIPVSYNLWLIPHGGVGQMNLAMSFTAPSIGTVSSNVNMVLASVVPPLGSSTPTSVVLTTSSSTVAQGATLTLTTTITPATAGGTVTFSDGSATLGTATVGSDGTASLLVSTLIGGTHALWASYTAPGSTTTYNADAVVEQVTFTIAPLQHTVITGPNASSNSYPTVKVFDPTTGQEQFEILAYDAKYRGAVRVAMGDFTGSGTPDIVTATGAGGMPLVNVYNGQTGQMLGNFYAYDQGYLGGVEVAVADVTGSGHPDIITSTDAGGMPLVNVFDSTGKLLMNFYAYDPNYIGGVRIASGDFAGDGKAEIVTSTANGGQPLINVFNTVGTMIGNFWGDDQSYTGGLQIAAGDFLGHGYANVATIRDSQTPSQVQLYDLRSQSRFATVTLGDTTLPAQLRLAAADVNADNLAELITVPAASGSSPEVEIFSSQDGSLIRKWAAYDPSLQAGLFVAAQ